MQRFDRAFHASDLRAYLACPRAFWLKEFMSQPPERRSVKMLHGSAMHCAIKRLHEDWNADPKQTYLAALNQHEFEGKEKDIPVAWDASDKDRDELANEAWAILENYKAKEFNRECTIVLAEAEFKVSIGGYDFEGKVDQVRKCDLQNGGNLWLLDFKTGNSRPSQQFLDLDYQFGIYTAALRDGEFKVNGTVSRPGCLPDRLAWYATYDHMPYQKKTTAKGVTHFAGDERGPAIYETKRTEQDLVALERDIKRVCGAIRMGTFPRNPSQITCAMCRWWDACKADRDEGSLSYSQGKRLAAAIAEEENE